MSFSDRLKQVMEEKNMSQAEISALTGIGKSSISQYLSGKNEPKPKAIEKIAEALDVSPGFLNGSSTSIDAEDDPKELKNISIQKAAELMGKSEQFVRVGLQRSILPFGTAVKLSSRWTYYISPSKFYDYVGLQK
ncbi:hypothetical protein SDC9_85962 [bioreactor metagenome]|uniref:HTH cro/C1-type domain-containing protein n=1 Tax=bioreactor metagenome TaxID=1076179 RepID=A0A644ZEY0_9ZZZZ